MKIVFLAISTLCAAGSIDAESITVGQTYPIAERDALSEIEARASEIDWQAALSTENIRWSAKDGTRISRALVNRSRQVVPFYTLEFDIRDANGLLIYPKGFRFNPLDHITLPYRVVVIDPIDVAWLKPQLTFTDRVILTHGDFEQASETLERPTFLLDDKTRQRLGIEFVPSIIEQAGNVFVVREYLNEVER